MRWEAVALDAHANLHHAPAQDDDAQGTNDGEDKVGKIVDDTERIVCGHSGDCQERNGQYQNRPNALDAASVFLRQGSLVHVKIPPFHQ